MVTDMEMNDLWLARLVQRADASEARGFNTDLAASPTNPVGHGAMVDEGLSLLVDPLQPLIDHTRERFLRGVRRLRQKHPVPPSMSTVSHRC